MRNFLKGQGLWRIVTGEEGPPEDASQEAQNAYEKRASQALHYIFITLMLSLTRHIQNETSPKAAWEVLTKVFEALTKARKL